MIEVCRYVYILCSFYGFEKCIKYVKGLKWIGCTQRNQQFYVAFKRTQQHEINLIHHISLIKTLKRITLMLTAQENVNLTKIFSNSFSFLCSKEKWEKLFGNYFYWISLAKWLHSENVKFAQKRKSSFNILYSIGFSCEQKVYLNKILCHALQNTLKK
jgi:hypothetical protein